MVRQRTIASPLAVLVAIGKRGPDWLQNSLTFYRGKGKSITTGTCKSPFAGLAGEWIALFISCFRSAGKFQILFMENSFCLPQMFTESVQSARHVGETRTY